MKIAILSFTEKGRLLSQKMAAALPEDEVKRFCHANHTDPEATPFSSTADQTAALFGMVQALIFVSAAGIAVRSIAPLVRSKAEDPAVLVADDCGNYVISLLSGHLGGANALTRTLAQAIGAEPVITTATDAGKAFSPDCYAQEHHLAIGDLTAAKALAAAVLDGEPVGFVSRLPGYDCPGGLQEKTDCRCGICITEAPEDRTFPVTLQLFPRSFVVGIGCRKGTSADRIEAHVWHCCDEAGIPITRLCAVSTIDIKAEEPGLLRFCTRHKLPLVAYTAEELMAVKGDFTASAFVLQTTGTDNVCERSAVLCSGGELVCRKTSSDSVTAAIARKESCP